MIIRKKLKPVNHREHGDVVQIVLLVTIFALCIMMAISLLGKSAKTLKNITTGYTSGATCPDNTEKIKNKLVNYVENYRINHPTRNLEGFIVSADNRFGSKQYDLLLSDKNFVEIADLATCTVYKYQPESGNKFTIMSGVAKDKLVPILKDNVIWEENNLPNN